MVLNVAAPTFRNADDVAKAGSDGRRPHVVNRARGSIPQTASMRGHAAQGERSA
ncbi:hypothetical protein C7S14_4396 [Burkholderia cepacia]|nr:hypothetical protein C7S14_4396 [Burkholderia cepacia]